MTEPLKMSPPLKFTDDNFASFMHAACRICLILLDLLIQIKFMIYHILYYFFHQPHLGAWLNTMPVVYSEVLQRKHIVKLC